MPDRPVLPGPATPVALIYNTDPDNPDGSSQGAMPVEQEPYATPLTGEIGGEITSKQCPDIPCSMVRFKARSDNATNVYLGTSTNVSKPNGADDGNTGYELAAGDDTGWIPIDNVNRFWIICDAEGDDLTFLALR